MSRWRIKTLAFAFLLTCLMINTGFGQTQNELVQAFERLNHTLEVVRQLVSSLENVRAMQLVIEAESLRNQAFADFQNENFVAAAAKIKFAFLKLEQAVRITLEGPVKRLRSRLEELMRQADNLVLGGNHKEAERILQEAKLNRDAAERALAN